MLLNLEEQQQLQVEHYTALQAENQRVRKLRHDIANHLQTMQSLLEQGYVEEASACFQKINDSFENTETAYYCENPIVNVLCYNKMHYASARGIEIDVHLSLSADTFVGGVNTGKKSMKFTLYGTLNTKPDVPSGY